MAPGSAYRKAILIVFVGIAVVTAAVQAYNLRNRVPIIGQAGSSCGADANGNCSGTCGDGMICSGSLGACGCFPAPAIQCFHEVDCGAYCPGTCGSPSCVDNLCVCGPACPTSSSARSSSASSVRCGDGIVNTGEKCDNGANNMSCGPYTSAWCKTNCTKPACSDGIDNDGDGKVDGADGGCTVYPDTPSQCGGTASSYGGYAWGNLRAQAGGGMAAPGKDDEGCAAGTYPREDGSCIPLTCPDSEDRPDETFSCRDQCTFDGSVDEGCVAFCVCNCDNGSGDDALSCYDSCMDSGTPPPSPLACNIPDESCCRGGCINSFCPAGDDDDNGGGIPGGGGGIPGGGGGIAGAIAGDGGTTTGTTGTTTGTTSGDTSGTGGSSASSRASSPASSRRSSSASSIRSSSRASSRASSAASSARSSAASSLTGINSQSSSRSPASSLRSSFSSRTSSRSSSASAPVCGNGRVEYGEECDAGAGNSDTEGSTCRTDCTLWFCGDGVTDSDGPAYGTVEQCDCGLGRFDSQTDDPADFECTQTLNGQTVKCTYYCQVTYCAGRPEQYSLPRDAFPCINGTTRDGKPCAVCADSSSSRSSISSRSSVRQVVLASSFPSFSSSRSSSRSSVRACDDATDCAWGQICSNGTCQNLSSRSSARSSQRSSLRPCQSDVECPNGQLCFDGFCRNPGSSSRSQRSSAAGCTADWQCPTGNCENGVCTGQSSSPVLIGGLCTGTECSMGGDAFCGAQGKSCQTMQEFPCVQCVTAQWSEASRASVFSSSSLPPVVLVTSSASSAPYLGCFSNNDCPVGASCVDGACIPCTENGQCPGNRCINNRCAPCSADSQCPAGARCIDGACSFCASDIDCDAGERCVNGQCLAADTIAQLPSFCGNGRLDPGESCDQGNANSDFPNALCRRDCTLGRCGDRVVDTPLEQCDDGNLTAGDGCSPLCQPERSAPEDDAGGNLPAQIIELPFQQGSQVAQQPVYQQPSNVAPETPAPPAQADTGPAALAVMAAGAAAGYGWMRRRKA